MNTQHQVLIQRGLTFSQPVSMDIAPAQPQIFRVGGINPGIIVGVKADQTQFLVSPSSPASAGDVLVIYCAGLGPVDQNVAAGSQTPVALINTVAPATVNIGGVDAPVFFAGLTPGFTGLYQINAQVPAGVTPGDSVPITISIAGQTSAAALMSVK
jgi:uncharacterized protein (TIGR03437 family)